MYRAAISTNHAYIAYEHTRQAVVHKVHSIILRLLPLVDALDVLMLMVVLAQYHRA